MMIEDEELRNLFKVASEEHLQKLDQGILHLEKNPEDKAPLEELLREAHSLKGDARMLDVKGVETLIHEVEHILGGVNRAEVQVNAALCDRLWNALDATRKLVTEAVTGEPAGVNTFNVLAQLIGANPNAPDRVVENGKAVAVQTKIETETALEAPVSPPESPSPQEHQKFSSEPTIEAEIVVEETAEAVIELPEEISEAPVEKETAEAVIELAKEADLLPQQPPSPPSPPPKDSPQTASPSGEPYRIETIRVPTHNLDALMTQAGELTVTKIRIEHRLREIEQIVALWEEWSRDNFVHRFALDSVGGNGNGVSLNGSLNQLKTFHARSEDNLEQLGKLINRLQSSAYEDTARLEVISDELEEDIRTLRLLPLSTIFHLFPRMVRDLSRQEGKDVDLIIEGGETKADKRILEEMKDPLMHMIRNCIDHGIETPDERELQGKPRTAKLYLRGYQTANNVVIEVADDGRGLNIEKIKQTAVKRGLCKEEDFASMTPEQIYKLIFEPGFSTRTFITEVSGRGVGLDVVRTNVERLKGSIQVNSTPGEGTTFRLQLGTTLATAHVLIVDVNDRAYAIPVEYVLTTQLIPEEQIFTIEGRQTIIFDDRPLSVVRLATLLELPITLRNSSSREDGEQNNLFCTILQIGNERLGLVVDRLLDEQDVVLKPQSKILKRVRNVTGATILGTGEVCMILNPSDLMKSVQKQTVTHSSPQAVDSENRKVVILLAEDSITTRTQEKRILEGAGYEVVTAVDGLDGFNKLKTRNFDAVVSDVQMPNMDGLTLAAKIRQQPEYNELPIILVTSLATDEDKRRGAEAGASAYITKGTFNQDVLLKTLSRLI